MIRGFRDKETQAVWQGRFSRKLPQDIQGLARRKLRMGVIAAANGASASMTNGESAFIGMAPTLTTLKSLITTEELL